MGSRKKAGPSIVGGGGDVGGGVISSLSSIYTPSIPSPTPHMTIRRKRASTSRESNPQINTHLATAQHNALPPTPPTPTRHPPRPPQPPPPLSLSTPQCPTKPARRKSSLLISQTIHQHLPSTASTPNPTPATMTKNPPTTAPTPSPSSQQTNPPSTPASMLFDISAATGFAHPGSRRRCRR